MKFSIEREAFLRALQHVIGVVERRQTLPVLSNVLIVADRDGVSVTATDLEVELVARAPAEVGEVGGTTVPGRKVADICRNLPEGAVIHLTAEGGKAVVRSGRSRFSLGTLAAEDFPRMEEIGESQGVEMIGGELRRLLERTHFAMAVQDVRYYLNGLLFEMRPGWVRTVATDGHRLAMCTAPGEFGAGMEADVIVPRKGIQELTRVLVGDEESVTVGVGRNHVRVELPGVRFTSKLVEGRFPDYERVVPSGGQRRMEADRVALKQGLIRASILSNEKYRGVRLVLRPEVLTVQAHNPEQEEAEEEIEVGYTGEGFEIGFNVNYLLDALNALESAEVVVEFSDANSSALIVGKQEPHCRQVVMPMRL